MQIVNCFIVKNLLMEKRRKTKSCAFRMGARMGVRMGVGPSQLVDNS